jgi:ABC-type multidrug transport system fused ATPase/permease subunit
MITIAHRLNTIRRADKIIVLDKGEIKEAGTHDELVVAGGLYLKYLELYRGAL